MQQSFWTLLQEDGGNASSLLTLLAKGNSTGWNIKIVEIPLTREHSCNIRRFMLDLFFVWIPILLNNLNRHIKMYCLKWINC